MRINYQGRMLRAEYRGADYADDNDSSRDLQRRKFRLTGLMPLPKHEWILLYAGFQHFSTEFDATGYEISSNRVQGGARIKFPVHFTLAYYFIFDRTASDSDYIATDNISHTFYATHRQGRAGLTIGYQNNINDDFEDVVRANSIYFSGWVRPCPRMEFRGEYGFRAETVDEGSRLVGDEDRNRYKISVKCNCLESGTVMLKLENKTRTNDQINSEAEFNRFSANVSLKLLEYGYLNGGYSYSSGEYENSEQSFDFDDNLFHADISVNEFHNFTPGFGVTYYRSRRDLDVESFSLNFKADYKFMEDFIFSAAYNVHNFDDFLVGDQYYTANIVEINIIKIISF
jgi:hypothetical protein